MERRNKLQGNYNSHADRYHDQIEEIRKIEDLFIHHEQEIDDAFQQLQLWAPQDAWDNLAPAAEESQQAAQGEAMLTNVLWQKKTFKITSSNNK